MHKSVLLQESTDLLLGNGGHLYVDCTVGLGGHTKAILEKNTKAFVVGIDTDPYALEIAQENLSCFKNRFVLYHANYRDLDAVLSKEGIDKVDGFLFDLGVSMLQIRSPRGFSFQRDDPLDMRMNPKESKTAYQVVNYYSQKDLEKILKEYGEEKQAKKISQAILLYRSRKPIQTTTELANIVLSVVPRKNSRIHPATKTFQAIRIEVNDELKSLEIALEKTIPFLKSSSRIVVISFHSLEDRMVKNFFKKHAKILKSLTKKPILPTIKEIKENPSSRSAKLRAGEKV